MKNILLVLPIIVAMMLFAGCSAQQPPGPTNYPPPEQKPPVEKPVIINPGPDTTNPGTTTPSDTGSTGPSQTNPGDTGNPADLPVITVPNTTTPSDTGTPADTGSPTSDVPPATTNPKTAQVLPPATNNCTVSFQPDPSGTGATYIVVKTDSPSKNLVVTCPDGKEAQANGGLYFCPALDMTKPVVASIDGKDCGSTAPASAAVSK
jgi:hypothetical protein